MAAIITLTTDFGFKGPFVGVMKGAILARLPDARIVDLTHEIPPHWPAEAGFWLARSWPWFPAGTVHVAVVDPGVGTRRDILAGERDGHFFLGPDNGLLWPILGPILGAGPGSVGRDGSPGAARCHRLSEAWRARQGWPGPSSTFHGRDIFAPLAAELAAGRVDISDIGPPAGELVPELQEAPEVSGQEIRGTIITIDSFGNLISNVDGELVSRFRKADVLAAGRRLPLKRTYGEVPPGEFLALINSFGVLEIARAEGNAAESLGLGRGAPVVVVNTTR